MKRWPRKHNQVFHKNHIVEVSVTFMVFVACFGFGMFLRGITAERDMELWKSLVLTPEPEICAMCGNGIPYHAPVLVDLSTGETGELRVYDPDPRHPYEPAEKQSTGTFSLMQAAGLSGCRDTCEHSCDITLPKKQDRLAPDSFCRGCRALLAGTAAGGYILADLHDLNEIKTYAITDHAEYTIRDYAVSISRQKETGGLSVHITGLLPVEGE